MLRSLAAAALWSFCASAALAAAPDAAPAPSPELGGPAVPGVCLLGQEAVLANAKIGQAASARLRALAQDAQAPLDAERSAIEADAKALEAKKASLPAADLRQRQQAIGQRAQAYQAKLQQLNRQIEATRASVVGRIATTVQPVVAQVYQAHKCGLLFSRNAVLGGNLAGDLTADVVAGLDGKVTTIDFDLEPPAAAPTK